VSTVISNKKIERLEHSAVKLSLTVPKEELSKEYESLLKEYSHNVRIDGFRKGHVPPAVLERKFGDSLRIDAMGRIIEKAVEEGVKDIEEKPLAYSTPSLEGEPAFSLDQDFSFSVSYDVFPSVEVGEWKALEFETPQADVGPEDEERELSELRERNAIVVEKEGEAVAERGDVVTVNYRELAEDGSSVEGTERSDFTFEVGTGYNLYKFDDDILGMKMGEEKVFEKSYPADFEYKELAGRKVRILASLSKVKAKKLPELDDDFAQDVSEKYKTLADLKADIRAHLEKRLAERLRQIKEKAAIEALLARSKADLPRSMVNAELGMRLESLKRQMGVDSDDKLDRLLDYSGKTRAALVEEWRPSAEKAITTRLVIEKLSSDGGYECSDADLEAELARQASESSLSIDEIKAEYEKRGSMDRLRDRIKEDKLMDAILAEAKLGKGPRLPFVDLFKDNE
jgi:trigger factor